MNNLNPFCTQLSQKAIKALLYEVSTTPKPGLVDRNNSGAHRDMDFFTFMASSSVLSFTFYECALAGMNYTGNDMNEILQTIRPIGIQGEKIMFEATSGVNTHKGLIFSLGIILAAAGYIYSKNKKTSLEAQEVCEAVSKITKGIAERELKSIEVNLTYGEKLYKKYGVKGIRGEVEAGFPTVMANGIPVLRELLSHKTVSLNDAFVQTLLSLMTQTEDSNILGRHDLTALEYVKEAAKEALASGGMLTEAGRRKIEQMDKTFIDRYISPGGSADLLAVTILLYDLENINIF